MTESTRESALASRHRALGSGLEDWNGMGTAWTYSSDPNDEHDAVREAAGLFDMSPLKKVFVRGPGAAELVDHVITRDTRKIGPGQSAYGSILTERGTVSEGPGGCIFIVRDGMLITPSVTSGILESVTRDTLILLARANGLACIEREIDRTELYIADEGFYCGTGQEVVPMLSVDRLPLGDGRPGPITRRLQALYDDEVRGRSDGHADWRTAVYEAA